MCFDGLKEWFVGKLSSDDVFKRECVTFQLDQVAWNGIYNEYINTNISTWKQEK